jgi:hypothetical protein
VDFRVCVCVCVCCWGLNLGPCACTSIELHSQFKVCGHPDQLKTVQNGKSKDQLQSSVYKEVAPTWPQAAGLWRIQWGIHCWLLSALRGKKTLCSERGSSFNSSFVLKTQDRDLQIVKRICSHFRIIIFVTAHGSPNNVPKDQVPQGEPEPAVWHGWGCYCLQGFFPSHTLFREDSQGHSPDFDLPWAALEVMVRDWGFTGSPGIG